MGLRGANWINNAKSNFGNVPTGFGRFNGDYRIRDDGAVLAIEFAACQQALDMVAHVSIYSKYPTRNQVVV